MEGKRAIVTGGNAGIGLGIVEALVEKKAKVFVIGRDHGRLAAVAQRLGVTTIAGDVTEEAFAHSVLREVRPDILVLNAGKQPAMAPIDEQTWEGFSQVWNHDVKAGLFWVQAALKLPLARGSRVIVSSSGAAVGGSPLSGGYAGAKRMLWLMARYANGVSADKDLGLRFQTILPMQLVPGTGHGASASEAYGKKKGVSPEAMIASFGKPLLPRTIGDHVVEILTDPRHDAGVAFGFKGEAGIVSLD
jgi:hypothetical protein